MDEPQFPTAAAFAQSVKMIYSMPSSYQVLSEAIDNPSNSMADISDLIANEPAMAMRILELANSAFYGFPSKIETISHALTLIGAQQVRDLILAAYVIDVFEGISSEAISMKNFWGHSISCGLAAKILASARHESNIERFFVLGLLHDIGRLVSFEKTPKAVSYQLREAESENRLLYAVERDHTGYTHADIGAELMSLWGFPFRMSESVRCHHNFSTAALFPTESAILHLGDIITHTLQIGSSGERFVPPLNAGAWNLLSLDPAALPAFCRELERQHHEVTRIMLKDSCHGTAPTAS